MRKSKAEDNTNQGTDKRLGQDMSNKWRMKRKKEDRKIFKQKENE